MKAFALLTFLMGLMLTPYKAAARPSAEAPATWEDFSRWMDEREDREKVEGISYMVSGVLAVFGGAAGAARSDEAFTRSVYAVTQTIGVGAMGYGASLYWNGNEHDSFYRAVRGSSLSTGEKTSLLREYLALERDKRDRARWIRAGTHAALALLNFSAASREENGDVRGVYQFLGALNLAIAFSVTF